MTRVQTPHGRSLIKRLASNGSRIRHLEVSHVSSLVETPHTTVWNAVCAVNGSTGVLDLAAMPISNDVPVTSPGGSGAGSFTLPPAGNITILATITFNLPAQPALGAGDILVVGTGLYVASFGFLFPGYILGRCADLISGTSQVAFSVPLPVNLAANTDVNVVMQAKDLTTGGSVTLPATVYAAVIVQGS